MIFVDTHAHLYVHQFDEDREEMIQRAKEHKIQKVFLPAIDSETHERQLKLEASKPDYCISMMGLHPCSVKADFEKELKIVEDYFAQRNFAAVGEIGIDLYWDTTFFEEQKEAFRRQINLAKAKNLPIVIHSRNSTKEVIQVLREEKDEKLRGIFHCFGGSVEEAQAIIELDFFLGIGGVVTFKKSGLDKTLEEVSLEHIVLETDAPYLSPTPFRGKRNESARIHQIADKVASIKNVSLVEVADSTTQNAISIFGASFFEDSAFAKYIKPNNNITVVE